MVGEFKKFLARGNLVDLAVGIMVGGAFNSLVKSFVDDILTPVVGIFLGKSKLDKWSFSFEIPAVVSDGTPSEVIVSYGKFLQTGLDFVILAFVIFMMVKLVSSLREKAEDPKNKEVPTPKDIELLAEIRDLLRESK